MALKKIVAKTIASVSLKMAKAASGSASMFGTYQPKEPAKLRSMKK